MESLRGHLLLANGNLYDPNFRRTVVFMAEHNEEGAMGVVLNRPSDNRLSDVIEAELPEPLRLETLFGGGPVQPAALSYLHTAAPRAGANVMKNLTVGHDLEDLIELGRTEPLVRRLRVGPRLEKVVGRLGHRASLDG